ncbi:MAG: prolipoprotein diacylglyceryl transferase family protein [Acidimicrobiales bacterium]
MLGAISYNPLVHIELGPLSVSPHGIGIAVGFVAGTRLMIPVAQRFGWDIDKVYSCVVRAAIGSIIGARLAYVLNHAGDLDSPLEVLKVWEGGISLLGGIFGAIGFALPAMRRHRLPLWKLMDACVPGIALGIVIGRIGDLVIADHLGKTTDFFLGYRCPPASVETGSPCVAGTIVHQTALYDLLLTCVLLAALLWLRRTSSRPGRYAGFATIVFGAWYGTQRIFEDFLREDVRRFGLTGSQITATVTVAVCVTWLVAFRRTPRWGAWDMAEPAAAAEPPDPTPPDPPDPNPPNPPVPAQKTEE